MASPAGHGPRPVSSPEEYVQPGCRSAAAAERERRRGGSGGGGGGGGASKWRGRRGRDRFLYVAVRRTINSKILDSGHQYYNSIISSELSYSISKRVSLENVGAVYIQGTRGGSIKALRMHQHERNRQKSGALCGPYFIQLLQAKVGRRWVQVECTTTSTNEKQVTTINNSPRLLHLLNLPAFLRRGPPASRVHVYKKTYSLGAVHALK